MYLVSQFLPEDDIVELINWCDDLNIEFVIDSYYYEKDITCKVKIKLSNQKHITYACLKWGFTK